MDKKVMKDTLFAERLKALRKKVPNLTQEKLAKELNVSHEAVKKWEQAKHCPKFYMIVKIANYFKCDLDYITGLQETPNKTYRHFSEETGLSEAAVESLMYPDKYGNRYGDIISALLENEELLSQIALCCKMDYTKVRAFETSVYLAGLNYHAICRPDYVRQSNEMNVYNSLCNFIADFREKNEPSKKIRVKITKLIVKFTEKEYSFIEDNFGITKDNVDNFSNDDFYNLQDKCFDIEEAELDKRKGNALSEFGKTASGIVQKIGDAILMREYVYQEENIKAPV